MKLQEALDQFAQLTDDDVIFARKPWTLDSEAEIGPFDEGCRVPETMKRRGLAYFLESHVIHEVLQAFGEHEPTPAERRALLLYYAQHDAYPDWLYEE
jgi:hypothetical protein